MSSWYFAISHEFSVPSKDVWEIITDTTRWTSWGPSLLAVESPTRYIQLGTKGRVKPLFGVWLTFEVTAFEKERYWFWKVGGVPATGHKIEPLGRNSTRLSFTVPYVAFPYAFICWKALLNIKKLINNQTNA